MENKQIADIFKRIADILELQGENPFRIISYRKSAKIIEDLPENLKNIFKSNKLENIPGIGKNTAKKIKEILKTGKCSYYQSLLKTPQAKLAEMMNIPGLGPKTLKQIYQELNISTVKQLEEAAKNNKLEKLTKLGKKRQTKILKGIDLFKKNRGRFKISEAIPYAELIIKTLKKDTLKIIFAGSLRRMQETVKDIDILAVPKTSSKKAKLKIVENFTNMPETSDILAKGITKSSIILNNGLQADLRLVNILQYGAALVYFTGSKQHNTAIRKIAKKKNLKINEYGVFNLKTNKKIAGKTEQDIYKSIGLSFIPPELRENGQEIQAALNRNLPNLIKTKNYKGDLHIHTSYSDGSDSIEQMALAGIEKGYKYLAITDHSQSVRIAGGLKVKRFLKEIEEIKKINKKQKQIRLLAGVEVDILKDGTLDFEDKILEKCDIVIAAVHSGFNMDEKEMTARVTKAMQNKNVNILAHPTGRIINKRNPYAIDISAVIETAKKYKIALELNSCPARLDLDFKNCKACKDAGVKIAVNTDAHSRYQLSNIKYGIHTARRGWLGKENVINTYPFSKLMKFLQK